MTQALESPEPEPGAPRSRRDRLRVLTTGEIIQTARRLLVASGPEAVTLRAIAREMGMTAPGLYRYFGSREDLIRNVSATLFTELAQVIDQAIKAAVPPGEMTGDVAGHMTTKMAAGCREFRRWALEHKPEFALLFGVPLPGVDDAKRDLAQECALTFAGVFFALFLELWQRAPFPVLAERDIDPSLRDQLASYRESLGTDVPLGTMLAFLRCWTLLYGALSMEVFGHMSFALPDPEPMFEITLADMAALVGLRYPPRP